MYRYTKNPLAPPHKGAPPPPVVLPGELKVDDGHRHEASYEEQHRKREKENAEERVDFVPQTLKNIVELDIDGREGQEQRQ